ncbi:hypothetical protein BAAM0483_08105 [Bifidobacterium animalis subsp. animalis MCC 0483]|uniref:Uncharacterized protein n=1 Tax=Bifidobacterium animalis subsp. animalis MCC 0483 TaxID=1365955 RepID=A0AB34T6X2_9BIFI|nr:hypothetical protein [Bifidobacterium animalis]KOA48438.1 hypothetical protein BAAM0483_08105 [Bifidobacterium animalis subsp. animalis MCC 0483]
MNLFGSQQEEQKALIDTPQIRETFSRCQWGGADGLMAQAQLATLVLAEVIRKMTVVVFVPDPSLYDDAFELEAIEDKRALQEARAAAKGETLGVLAAQRLRDKEDKVKALHGARMRFRSTQQSLIQQICSDGWRGGGPCMVNGETMYCYQGCVYPEGPEDLAKIADMKVMDADSVNGSTAGYTAPVPGIGKRVGMLVGNSAREQERAIKEGYALLQSAGVDYNRLDPELRYNVKVLKELNDNVIQNEGEREREKQCLAAAAKARSQKSRRMWGVLLIVVSVVWAFLNCLMLLVGSGSFMSILLNLAILALGIMLVRKKKETASDVSPTVSVSQ